jgi:hypothetical protein
LTQLGEDVDDDAFWIAKLGAAMGESAGIDLGIDHARLSALDAQARLNHFGECMQRAGVLPPGAGLGPVRGLLVIPVIRRPGLRSDVRDLAHNEIPVHVVVGCRRRFLPRVLGKIDANRH